MWPRNTKRGGSVPRRAHRLLTSPKGRFRTRKPRGSRCSARRSWQPASSGVTEGRRTSSRASSSVDVGMSALDLAHEPHGLGGDEEQGQDEDSEELEVHPDVRAEPVRDIQVGRAEDHEEPRPTQVEVVAFDAGDNLADAPRHHELFVVGLRVTLYTEGCRLSGTPFCHGCAFCQPGQLPARVGPKLRALQMTWHIHSAAPRTGLGHGERSAASRELPNEVHDLFDVLLSFVIVRWFRGPLVVSFVAVLHESSSSGPGCLSRLAGEVAIVD